MNSFDESLSLTKDRCTIRNAKFKNVVVLADAIDLTLNASNK